MKIFKFSSKNGFSGIAIHTIPQLGIPVSVARYLNGRIISSVMMVSDTEEGMVENARKAFSIIGPLTIRSKVRLMTRSSGCDSNGSYGEGGTSTIPGFERLSNGLFWDGHIIGMIPTVMGCRMYAYMTATCWMK